MWEGSECCSRGQAAGQSSVRMLGRHSPLTRMRREGRKFFGLEGLRSERLFARHPCNQSSASTVFVDWGIRIGKSQDPRIPSTESACFGNV